MADIDNKCREQERDEGGPVRSCAVTGLRRPQGDLLRFVLGPSNEVVPDLRGKLPGRGVWITAARDCVVDAVDRRVFSRAFRTVVEQSVDLAGQVEQLLAREAMQRLSLANKAGQVLAGFAKVENAIRSQSVAYLVQASDGGEDGAGKLSRLYKAVCGEGDKEALVVDCFTGEQLSLALGRSNVVHAALSTGGAADKFISAAANCRRYIDGREAYAAA